MNYSIAVWRVQVERTRAWTQTEPMPDSNVMQIFNTRQTNTTEATLF